MSSNYWDENATSDSSQVLQTPDALEDLSRAIRIGLDGEHHWSSSDGTTDRGTHRIGSARGYLDVQSNLSHSGSSATARFYVASDTSRLFVFPSSGTTLFLGSARVPEVTMEDFGSTSSATDYYPGQNIVWTQEVGKGTTDGVTSNSHITFGNTYGVAPVVVVNPIGTTDVFANLALVGTSGFTVNTVNDEGNGQPSTDFNWLSIGTITL